MNIGVFLIYVVVYAIMCLLMFRKNIIIDELNHEAEKDLEIIIRASIQISAMEQRIKELEEEIERLKGCK
ncbi:hypothetical protein [Anaerosacchariphilus polymeriproducens]|uniref:Uncharacterized protein n=1 Tax=Anaerosacchariphilus polymeriproducens TaxID=1812858 RepID=A0A371AT73_9FIRM|nr:hypothetical protein [Anaerosacchariphilus polymeriproducens]RDU22773.1 hypothetical protein DWV06_13470 [Anaerosacchariphilus polymeriproducens]